MSRRESPSNRYLQRMCGYWRRLDVPLREGDATEARDDGDELHALAADEINGSDEALGSENAIAMFVGLRPLLDELRARNGATALAEVSYAFSPSKRTARRLGVGIERETRNAMLVDDEYPATCDLVLLYDDEIEIFDHKTTWVGGTPQDATDQLVTYLAIAALAESKRDGTATPIVVSTEDSQLGVPIHMDELALELELDDLTFELGVDISNAQPAPGPWCHTRYCKARAACPATSQAIERVLPPESLVRPYTPGQGYADAKQLERGRVARKLLEEAIAAMKSDERDFLEAHGDVEFADGSTFYLQKKTVERAALDVPGALEVLRKEGADRAVKKTVAWSDIKKLVGKAGEAAVRAELRKIHALKVSTYLQPATKGAKDRSKSLIESFDEQVAATLAAAEALDEGKETQ